MCKLAGRISIYCIATGKLKTDSKLLNNEIKMQLLSSYNNVSKPVYYVKTSFGYIYNFSKNYKNYYC